MLSAEEFVLAAEGKGVGAKSALIEHAALARGLVTTRFNRKEVLVEPPGDAIPIFFHEMNGPRSGASAKIYCLEKTVSRDILRQAGLSVPASQAFEPDDLREGLRWAEDLGYPVVVKPASEGGGRGVTAGIRTPEAFEAAWRRARTAHQGLRAGVAFARGVREAAAPRRARGWLARAGAYVGAIREGGAAAWERRWTPVLVERHHYGHDFRMMVVGGEVVAVMERRPANIVGDGRATVLELIDRKNELRARNPILRNYPIPRRLDRLDVLAAADRSLADVPKAGETLVLRSAANLGTGGDSVDLTDEAHPGFKEIAVRAVNAIPGMVYGGVDIIAPDIIAPPASENHIVSEVEYSPGISPTFPLVGETRDIAGAVLSYYLEHGVESSDDGPDSRA